MYLRKEVSFLFLVFPCIPPPPQFETYSSSRNVKNLYLLYKWCISMHRSFVSHCLYSHNNLKG